MGSGCNNYKRSAYYKYMSDMSDNDKKLFIDNVTKLYLKDNKTMREISDILDLDFNIIRGCINHNNIKKSKDMQYKKISEAREKTFIEKYGVENVFMLDNIKSKIKSTNLERYGDTCALRNEDIKNKRRETCIKRYGVDNPSKSSEVKDKIHDHLSLNMPDNVKDILYTNTYKFEELVSSIDYTCRTPRAICDKIGYYTTTVMKRYYELELDKKYPVQFYRSHYENEVHDYIVDNYNGTVINNRKIAIYPYELDLYIPDRNLGIEFNGDYWHSDINTSYDYHQKKSLYAKDKGIFIYHIWEHEWNDPRKNRIIKSQLINLLNNNAFRIYARKCEVREVSPKDSREFLDNNHIQGNRNSSIKLGLYYNNELVSLMTFGKDKFIDKSDNYQLLRFCNKLNTSVVGGASKLFKYFLDNYNYDNKSIISYCDISKGKGIVYEKLGFKLDKITSPNYIWINLQTGDLKSRYQCQMKNEESIMISNGYARLFDCGNYKFIY